MFDGSTETYDPLKANKNCTCTVTNRGPQQYVAFTTVDIRLESYTKGVNQSVADCSSALFGSSVLVARCQEGARHYEYSFYNDVQESILMTEGMASEIILTNLYKNSGSDSPAMVWISLEGK